AHAALYFGQQVSLPPSHLHLSSGKECPVTEQDHDPDQLRDQLRAQLSEQSDDQTRTADTDGNRDMDTSVFEAINLARSAALKAGIGVDTERRTREDGEEQ